MPLCTNKPGRASRLILDRLGLAEFFSTAVTGESLRARKPDPAPLCLALAELEIEAEEAVLGTAMPAAVIDHFSDLPDVLRSLGATMPDSL